MKNGVNSIKTTQQLIVHMFKTKKPYPSSKNSISNSNKTQSKNNLAVNFKHSLISQNLNPKNKKTSFISNLSNRTKYKTAKSSPEQILIQKNLSRQKKALISNQKYMNKPNNNMPISNSINKIIFQNQKHNNTMKDDAIKKRIMQIKQRKSMFTMNSNNNSMSLSNIYNYNFNHKHNNSNSNSNTNISYFQNKGIYINKIKKSNISIGQQQQPNSYREKSRSNSNYDIDNINNNIKHFNNNKNKDFSKEKKYYNLINKYISSSSISFKQPMRPQRKSLKSKFNTINAKGAIDIYKQGIQSKQGLNIINANKNKNNTQKNKNVNMNNMGNLNINKNNYIFSSTSNNLYKTKQQSKKIPNFHFNVKIINKTSYQTKQNSRKHSAEKSIQNSMNNSSINHIINSSSSNYFLKNYNSPAITVNNHRKSDICYKKIDYLNNGNNNNFHNYSNNKNNIGNGIYNNNKYRFSGVYSSDNSVEHSKENNHKKSNMVNIKDLKRYNVEKIINQLYKHKESNNSNSQYNDSKNLKNKNNFMNIKEEVEQENNINNSNNNKNFNLHSQRESKEKKNIFQIKESNNTHNTHHSKQLSDSMNINIINKIIINGDNYNLLYKNKEISPITIKSKSKEINEVKNVEKKENENNDNEDIAPIDEELLIIDNKESINENKSIEKDFDKSQDKNENEKKINKKEERDKDLSCSENEKDDLLTYVNKNIDYIKSNVLNNTDLTESNDSITSSLKESGKFASYNRDMEIISNYIQKYYKKNKKYPTTKMKFYKYGRLLGKGAFGKVNLCLHVLTGRLVAIKSINKEKISNERRKQKIKLETKIMKRLSKSNNIVKIFETYETKKHFCIVMEYICAGDLLSYIKKRNKLQEPVAKFIFKQIILALKFIHENNIVHRDIKLDNILIDLDNNIKICDFGVSKIVNKGDIMLEQCGTPAYIAPEILLNKGYEGFGVDIWSAGVVLYAMLSGTVPFKGNDIKELHNSIITGNYQQIKDISKEASHLLNNILEVDPSKRITTENILNHPWLIDVDLNFWKNQNLFTNAEYVLLAKSNVDYRKIENKEDMIENFDIRNLDTTDENINKNIKTKSFILAPFNTSKSNKENPEINTDSIHIEEITDFNNPDLKILNGVIKYMAKVKDLNRNYELNNNQEIDNGIVILPNESDEKNKKENDNIITPVNRSDSNSKKISKYISPQNEVDDNYKNKDKEKEKDKDEINIKALETLENLGYDKKYVKECIYKNHFNYATASYRLIVKYCFS